MSDPSVMIVSSAVTGSSSSLHTACAAVQRKGLMPLGVVTAIAALMEDGNMQSYPMPLETLRAQLQAALGQKPKPVAAALGYLATADAMDFVADVMESPQGADIPVVLDPALVDARGRLLVDIEAMATLKRRLIFRAQILSVDIKEARCITGLAIESLDEMRHAAEMLLTMGSEAVHLRSNGLYNGEAVDIVASEHDITEIKCGPDMDKGGMTPSGITVAAEIASGFVSTGGIKDRHDELCRIAYARLEGEQPGKNDGDRAEGSAVSA